MFTVVKESFINPLSTISDLFNKRTEIATMCLDACKCTGNCYTP
jgi:hypothetical protein